MTYAHRNLTVARNTAPHAPRLRAGTMPARQVIVWAGPVVVIVHRVPAPVWNLAGRIRAGMRTARRVLATVLPAVIVAGVLAASMLAADPASARMIDGPDTRPDVLRVTHVEPDNGRRLMWSLSNGAHYVTARPAACRRENRPAMCRAAYRTALRTYGVWWLAGSPSWHTGDPIGGAWRMVTAREDARFDAGIRPRRWEMCWINVGPTTRIRCGARTWTS